MSFSQLARRFEGVASLLSNGGRHLLGLDTNPVPADWDHVTKVDPEEDKHLPLAFTGYLSYTDAVSVGGSRGVTADRTEETFDMVTDAPVPAFHEPSAARHVTPETTGAAEFLAVPEVLNGDSEALIGTLGEGLDYVREDLGPDMIADRLGISLGDFFGNRVADFAAASLMDRAIFEAYIIMNPDSAAAREANVAEDDLLSPDAARKRALAAEYHLESEVVYLEYSGTFGGEEAVDILNELEDAVSWGRIWYGGGLDSSDRVETVRDAGAETVVVGDIFHDIAEYEAMVVEQAQSEFDASTPEGTTPAADGGGLSLPDSATVREWMTEAFSLEESPAARYLSTVPAVDDPVERAAEQLTAAVRLVLTLDALAAALDDPDVTSIRTQVRDWQAASSASTSGSDEAAGENSSSGTPAGDNSAAPTTQPDIDSDVAYAIGVTLLSSRFGVERGDGGYPASHLAVDF